jgi:hypothetical protein
MIPQGDVGSLLRVIKKKLGLAANNGDTLGEAVISVEVMNSDQNVKKFQHKTTDRKTVLHHHQSSFFSEVKKM